MQLFKFATQIQSEQPVASIIISVALMLIAGFLLTRVTKLLRLPNVTAYIVAGILIGPYCLNLMPQRFIDGTSFLSDIALAFIAFSTGEFFKLDVLKKNGMKVVWITVFESVLASLLVFVLTFFILHMDLAFSIVLSALASATAPASTMMTIRQTGAKGDFVDTLLQVVALDDVVGLVLYSVAISIALASLSGSQGFSFQTIGKPILLNMLTLFIGACFGLAMKLLMPQSRSTDNKLIISVALLFAFCGVCVLLDVSPLLGCMVMGTVYTNIAENDKLFKQLGYFSPPILLLFFVRSGMNFKLDALFNASGDLDGVPLIVVGVSYFLVRIVGKYVGAWFGCFVVKKISWCGTIWAWPSFRRQASPSVLPRLARERLVEPWAAIWRQLSSRPAFFMNCSVPAARSLPCTSPNPIPQGSRMSRLWKRLRRAANGKRRRSFSLSESAKSRRSFLPACPWRDNRGGRGSVYGGCGGAVCLQYADVAATFLS